MNTLNVITSALTLFKFLNRIKNHNYNAIYRSIDTGEDQKKVYFVKNKRFNKGKQYAKSFGLLGLCFGNLLNRKISGSEFNRIIYLSFLAPVYDDLFDKNNIPNSYVINLLTQPYDIKVTNEEEILFLEIYKMLFKELNKNADFLNYFIKLTHAQERSKRQALKGTSLEEIIQITSDKGGFSCLLLRSVLDKSIKPDEEKAFYQLGVMSQLMDDIFDWYDDTKNHVKTVANSMTLKEFELFYRNELDRVIQLFSKIDNSSTFISLIKLLLSPGLVCLNHYKELNIETTGSIAGIDRSRVICDMELFKNQWKLLNLTP